MKRLQQLAPIARPDAEVLILGSMNSFRALETGEYYAHPSNRFWPLMAELFGTPRTAPYAERVAVLQQHKIAVWGPIDSCTRHDKHGTPTNNDSDIADVVYADLKNFLAVHPKIGKIFFNGRESEKRWKEYLANTGARFGHIKTQYLPSTSGINRHFDAKKWRVALLST